MTTKPIKRKAFEVPEGFMEHLSSIKDKALVGEIQVLCERVKDLVANLGISDDCLGFIIDGDLAMSWRDCFSEEHQRTLCVSYSLFLSIRSRLTQSAGHPPIHAPDPHIHH